MPPASPSTSMSTPALSLRTDPTSPSATACRYTNGRNPTPCTVPVTRDAAVRATASASADPRAAGRPRACRRSGCRRRSCAARRCPRARRRSRRSRRRPRRAGGRAAPPSAASASSGGDDRDDLALVGDVQRIDAEQVAGAGHRRARPAARASSSTTARPVSRASSLHDRADAAAGRVAQPARRRARRRAGRSTRLAERRGVGADVGLEGEVAAGEHHRHAVVGDRARHEHDVAGPHRARGRGVRPAGTTPTPAVVMYSPSAAPRSTTLVSPVTIGDAGRGARPRPCRRRCRAARRPGTPPR